MLFELYFGSKKNFGSDWIALGRFILQFIL